MTTLTQPEPISSYSYSYLIRQTDLYSDSCKILQVYVSDHFQRSILLGKSVSSFFIDDRSKTEFLNKNNGSSRKFAFDLRFARR